MSQIRGDIIYNHQLCETNQQIKHLHIATLIILNDDKTKTEEPDIQNIIDDDWRINNSEEINIQDEDDFNEKKNNNEIVEPIEEYELQQNNLIYEWINAIQKENQVDNSDDEICFNRE